MATPHAVNLVADRLHTLGALGVLVGALALGALLAAAVLLAVQHMAPPRFVVGPRPRLVQPPLALGPGRGAGMVASRTGGAPTAVDVTTPIVELRTDPAALVRQRVEALTRRVDELNRQLAADQPS